MICKFCNAEIQDELEICPICGKNLKEEELSAENVAEETVVGETSVQEVPAVEEEPEQPAKKKVWPVVLAVVGAVAALGILAVVLLTALGVDLKPKANDIRIKENYMVTDEVAAKSADTVVATFGDKELTNNILRIYYRMQVIDFLNYYGDYISYIGFDYTKPLSEQSCAYDENMTWEQYFLDVAISTWQNYETLCALAEKEDFVLDQESQEVLDNLPAELQTQADDGEYESVDAMLAEIVGPGCTLESYLDYVKTFFISNSYYDIQYEKLLPSDEDAEKYFTEHAEEFETNGITKDSGLISSVRHILVCVQGGTTDEETGAVTYTESEWEACLKEAEAIVQEWKDGGATEEGFVELVSAYTEDSGSITTGGLYEGVYKGSGMVEPFETWAIDSQRKPGDFGIVKVDESHYKGYHIMYFVGGEEYWLTAARETLLTDITTAMIEEAKAQSTMKVNYKNIEVVDLELA